MDKYIENNKFEQLSNYTSSWEQFDLVKIGAFKHKKSDKYYSHKVCMYCNV